MCATIDLRKFSEDCVPRNLESLTFLVNLDFYEKKWPTRLNGNALRIVFRDTFVQNRLPTNSMSGAATWKHSSNRSHHLLSRERNKREDYRQRRRKNTSLFWGRIIGEFVVRQVTAVRFFELSFRAEWSIEMWEAGCERGEERMEKVC